MVKWLGKVSDGIAGQHPFGRPNALLAQGQQVRRAVPLGVVPAKAVQRDQHHVMRVLRRRRIGAVVDMNDRQGRIRAGPLPRHCRGAAPAPMPGPYLQEPARLQARNRIH